MVTWTLTPAGNGTRVRLVHSGFVLPKNGTAYRNMSEGWKEVLRNLDDVSADMDAASASSRTNIH